MRSRALILGLAMLLTVRTASAQNPCLPGNIFRPQVQYLTGTYAVAAVTGDFNEDGAADLAIANYTANTVSILFGAGNGIFSPGVSILPTSGGPRNLALADLNKDDITDLIVTCLDGNLVQVFRGAGSGGIGDGSFQLPTNRAVSAPRGLTVADFDEDGILDLAVASQNEIAVLKGGGTGGVWDGTFVANGSYPAAFPWAVAHGDWNQDGILDLAVANFSSSAVSTLVGNGTSGIGTGTFSAGPFFIVSALQSDIVARDLNDDGRSDLAVSCGSVIGILLGQAPSQLGAVNFAVYSYQGGANHNGIAAADFTADGLIDLAATNPSGSSVLLYRGTGGGAFAGLETYPVDAGPVALTAGDFDGNGTSDLAVTNSAPGTVSILMSNCGTPPRPLILDAVPRGGRVGDAVSILGDFFFGTTSVRFNGIEATFTAATSSLIETTVPPGATTGPIAVTTPSGTGTSTFDFFVGETPEVLSATPDFGKIGAVITIAGLHFAGATRVAFGPASHAPFTVDSDGQITARVDGPASTGPISVTTPAATGTSSFTFTVIPFDTAARIFSVRDVPGDEGGRVTVKWIRSDLDMDGLNHVTGYRVWRRAPLGAVAAGLAAVAPAGWRQHVTPAGDIVFWEPLAEIPAAYLDGYAYLAATTQDSTEESNPYTAFFVQALTTDPFVFYHSPVDSGYSVDNRGPKKPPKFTASYTASGVRLRWSGNAERDLHGYRLHRGTTLSFQPDTGNLVFAGIDTAYADTTGAGHYYLLAAIDVHGNKSRYALVTPQGSTTGIAYMVETHAAPNRVTLTWYVIGLPGARVFLDRRSPGGPWERIATRVADGAGMVTYRDTEVRAGTRLGYRLRMIEEEAEVFSDEVWVDVPEARLALLGVRPNPILAGNEVVVSFLLPSDGPAALQLLDITGRVVAKRGLGWMEAGVHEARLAWERRSAPGIYWIRLAHGDQAATAKLGVLR